jgi:hypothetical protein
VVQVLGLIVALIFDESGAVEHGCEGGQRSLRQ